MILSGQRKASKTLELLFDRLEREAAGDPFIAACERILASGSEEVVQGFLVNIYAVLDQVDGAQKEAEYLRQIVQSYLESLRRRKRRAG